MLKILAILLFPLLLQAKPKPEKVIGLTCVYLAGATYGLRETILWHYPQFKKIHPNANDQFWWWKLSYKNKYTSKVPFATTAMVWTTDGAHLLNTLHKTFILGGAITIGNGKRKFRHYVADFALSSMIYNIGFHTTYTLIY
jgi:hypothetical protein